MAMQTKSKSLEDKTNKQTTNESVKLGQHFNDMAILRTVVINSVVFYFDEEEKKEAMI